MKEITRRWIIFFCMWMIVFGMCFMIYSIIPQKDKIVEKQNEILKNGEIHEPTTIKCNKDNTSCVIDYRKTRGIK